MADGCQTLCPLYLCRFVHHATFLRRREEEHFRTFARLSIRPFTLCTLYFVTLYIQRPYVVEHIAGRIFVVHRYEQRLLCALGYGGQGKCSGTGIQATQQKMYIPSSLYLAAYKVYLRVCRKQRLQVFYLHKFLMRAPCHASPVCTRVRDKKPAKVVFFSDMCKSLVIFAEKY